MSFLARNARGDDDPEPVEGVSDAERPEHVDELLAMFEAQSMSMAEMIEQLKARRVRLREALEMVEDRIAELEELTEYNEQADAHREAHLPVSLAGSVPDADREN